MSPLDNSPQQFGREHPSGLDSAISRIHCRANDVETLRAVAMLRAAGVDTLVLKGTSTRRLLGEADSIRPSSDVDILVSPKQFQKAQHTLSTAGYRLKRGVHANTWYKPGRSAIDLHWTIARSALSPLQTWEALWQSRELIACAEGSVHALNRGAALTHLAIHASQNDSDRPWKDFTQAVDRAQPEDIEAAQLIASQLGIAGVLAWAFATIGKTELAEYIGSTKVEPNTPHEEGLLPFITSHVHWREKTARVQRNVENWVKFHASRAVRFATGKSMTNDRIKRFFAAQTSHRTKTISSDKSACRIENGTQINDIHPSI